MSPSQMRQLFAVVWCVSAVASAQAPVVMSHPLVFKRVAPGVGAEDKDSLQRDFDRLLRQAGAAAPDFAKGEEALKALTWGDCEREDACLSQLATLSGALYGLYTSIDYTLEGVLVVSGRVVRDDGKIAAPTQVVRLPRGGSSTFRDVAKQAFADLFAVLKIKDLPAVRPVELSAKLERPIPEVVSVPPASSAVAESGGARRTAGHVALGVGGGAVVIGAVLFGAGQAIGAQLQPVGGALPAEQVGDFRAASGLATAGVVGMSLGAAAAVTGAILWVTAPSPIAVTVGPTKDGAMLGVQGEF